MCYVLVMVGVSGGMFGLFILVGFVFEVMIVILIMGILWMCSMG